MHWTFRYLGKHAAQKVLGLLPYGYLVQDFVKRATGRRDRFTGADAVRATARRKIDQFNGAGIEPPEVVVEQGTGWLGLDLVLFHLAGSRRIFSYDTLPWLRTELLRRNAAVLAGAPDLVKRWRGSDPAAVDERARDLQHRLDAPREMLLESLGAAVRVTRSMDRSEIVPASVDLFYSHSVLQFMDPGDLAVLVRNARRFLKPSGRLFHAVDCFDGDARHDSRIPRLAYLAWPEPVWNLLTSRYLSYQNRWRMPRFVTLFENEGFRVCTLNPVVHDEDATYVRRRLAHDPRLTGMSVEGVATSHFELTGRPA